MRFRLLRLVLAAGAALAAGACNKDEVIIDPDLPVDANFRPAGPESSPLCDIVYDYTPAPGQFINDAGAVFTTAEDAAAWAEARLQRGSLVSLGAFGGYIVVGFDHSIRASADGGYDFAVAGNAFYSEGAGMGNSNEPGIVYVMRDENANGLPDDTWYMLAGSETDVDAAYAVTYFRPEAPESDIRWTDNRGAEGVVPYMGLFHRQEYYYPAWIKAGSYTLAGALLPARNLYDPETGFWSNNPYEYGYADNMGADNISIGKYRQCNRFRIADAVDAQGNPVELKYIDYVKIQTGVNAVSGHLGEISTEVAAVIDLSLWAERNP